MCANILSITGFNSENFFRNHYFEHASFSEIKKNNIISIDSIMAEVTFQNCKSGMCFILQ